ncbi:MAG: hypothetical protein E6I67_08010 [Chloroflexi bacterium]|nr:MAG: hypothetical protein E6I67_08010 [Chloroflexota bacterium]
MLWLFAIVIGLVFGVITGGKIGNLAKLRFRWPWLILAAVVVRESVVLTPLNRVDGARYLYVLSLAAIVAWTIWQFDRLRGIWLITAGAALNLLVIVVNGARMPVAPELAGSLLRRGNVGQYTVMGSGTHLNLLGDWISLYPSPEAYSPGDVLIGVGLAIVVFLAVRNPSVYKELTPP